MGSNLSRVTGEFLLLMAVHLPGASEPLFAHLFLTHPGKQGQFIPLYRWGD